MVFPANKTYILLIFFQTPATDRAGYFFLTKKQKISDMIGSSTLTEKRMFIMTRTGIF